VVHRSLYRAKMNKKPGPSKGAADKLVKRDCCVSSHMSQFGQCGLLGHAASNSPLMNRISPLTPDVLLWIWPRLIVRIVSIPLRVALADRSDRKL